MLSQSGGAQSVAPRQGGRRVGPFTSLTAVSLLAMVGAAAFAPAQAADLNGKVSTIQNEEEFGFRKPEVFDWSGVYVGGHLGAAWGDLPVVETIVGGSVVVESVERDSEVDGSLAGRTPKSQLDFWSRPNPRANRVANGVGLSSRLMVSGSLGFRVAAC